MNQKLLLKGFEMGYRLPGSAAELYTIANDRHIYIPEGLTLYQATRLIISRLIPEELYPAAEKMFFKKLKLNPADEPREKVRETEPSGWEEFINE